MSVKPNVVYWNNIPAPYMVERFNALAENEDIKFEAWFNERIESDRSWEVKEADWKFRYKYLPQSTIGGIRIRWPLPLLGKKCPDVIVSLYAEPIFVVGWVIAKIRKVRTAFWCQVTFDSWVQRKVWKNIIKRFMFSRVDAIFGSGEESRQFAIKYGAQPSRAHLLRHSIDVEHYMQGADMMRKGRESSRKEIGVIGTTFIYVGRLWSGKGINYLLDAFEKVQQRGDDEVSLLLVGDGIQEMELQQSCIERGIRNVIFTGFRQKTDLPRYYAAADVFIFPTLGDPYGLVVDEAMASSLPVISTRAAGEICDRVEEGVNGFIVPPEDSETLASRMLLLVNNEALCVEMGKVSKEKIKGHTPEQWAKDFENAVSALIKE